MKGMHHVVVQGKRIQYAFDLCRNITVIEGMSGTGKTTLISMLRLNYQEGASSGVTVSCDKPCIPLDNTPDWSSRLMNIHDSIVFLDEDCRFMYSHDFAAIVNGSDNYFVLITRQRISELPYSVTEIYGIRASGKYAELKPV